MVLHVFATVFLLFSLSSGEVFLAFALQFSGLSGRSKHSESATSDLNEYFKNCHKISFVTGSRYNIMAGPILKSDWSLRSTVTLEMMK